MDYSNSPKSFDVVLYHKFCSDGFSAAWVARKYCLENCLRLPEFVGIAHDGIYDFPESVDGKSVLVLDLSFPHEKMLELKNRASSVFVIDHHLSAPERCEKSSIPLIYDVDECGSSLTWKVYFPDQELPLFLEYIRAGDLWKWGNLQSDKDVVTALHSYENDFANWDMFLEDGLETVCPVGPNVRPQFIRKYTAEGQALERKASKSVKDLLTRVVLMDMAGHTVPVVNSTEHISKLGNEMALAYPDSPFAAVYFDDQSKGMRHWSLRSVGDNDVSGVAKGFGGGGHKNAAGFSTKLHQNNLRLEDNLIRN